MSDTRIEEDSMGQMKVPAGSYYGAQTQRAVLNFPVSGLTMRGGRDPFGYARCSDEQPEDSSHNSQGGDHPGGAIRQGDGISTGGAGGVYRAFYFSPPRDRGIFSVPLGVGVICQQITQEFARVMTISRVTGRVRSMSWVLDSSLSFSKRVQKN